MPISRRFITKDGEEITVGVEDSERQRCEVWSRCIGYFRPISEWNAGKISEWKDRKFLQLPADIPDVQPRLPGTV